MKVYGYQKLQQYVSLFAEFSIAAVKYTVLRPIAQLRYGKRRAWLIAERGTDARDNGYHMFRYIRTNHPEVEAYYVISKDSPDRHKVAPYGNIVEQNSLQHYLLFLGARYLVSTHVLNYAPDYNFYQYMLRKRKCKLFSGKQIFLQHGITSNDLLPLHKENSQLSLFICSAKPEYSFIFHTFGYSAEVLKRTGLARFDNLKEYHTKRQILIMPTWRRWLVNQPGLSAQNVIESDYFRTWKSLLQNPKLTRLSEEYNVDFVFYPHYEMQKYLSDFGAPGKHLVMADLSGYDVQELLKESMLLITDYSSVFFDFAYMKKPLLYYQFDKEQFHSNHYSQGYFDYQRDGFGDVMTEEAALLSAIEAHLAANCQIEEKYRARIRNFFIYDDRSHCEQIYEEIIKLK